MYIFGVFQLYVYMCVYLCMYVLLECYGLFCITAPANVPPGTPTDGECDEDDFRYFQVECPAFTETVIIEQLDIVGTCSLYVSVDIVNPSPVDPTHITFRNETFTVSRRTLFVTVNAKKVIYLSCMIIACLYFKHFTDCLHFHQRNC